VPTIKFEGHACFLITTDDGVRVLTDPYEPGGFGGAFAYGPITDAADVVLVTHEHGDHNYVQGVPGEPVVVRESEVQEGVEFEAVPSRHGRPGLGDILQIIRAVLRVRVIPSLHGRPDGQDRGGNRIFVWEADGVRFCHLGDLGFLLDAEQVAALAPVDVAFVPVGGKFTLDAAGAHQVVAQLQARVAIPMHYATDKVNFPIGKVDDFLREAKSVIRVGGSEWSVSASSLPEAGTVVVLEPAC
jgi:L-ascorbate metabolism protein UlaG (beta-lactamase superfamily)